MLHIEVIVHKQVVLQRMLKTSCMFKRVHCWNIAQPFCYSADPLCRLETALTSARMSGDQGNESTKNNTICLALELALLACSSIPALAASSDAASVWHAMLEHGWMQAGDERWHHIALAL